MSYRPDNQTLEEPIEKTLEGVDWLSRNINNRIDHQESWDESHIDDLVKLEQDLLELKVRLLRLKKETW